LLAISALGRQAYLVKYNISLSAISAKILTKELRYRTKTVYFGILRGSKHINAEECFWQRIVRLAGGEALKEKTPFSKLRNKVKERVCPIAVFLLLLPLQRKPVSTSSCVFAPWGKNRRTL
jgi:hypothetical protein